MPSYTSEATLPRVVGAAPSEDEVRAQLERILGHPAFEASARVRDFLLFVVEEALAGRADRLKGYTIAVELFGRPPDFDANLDPIVRIQAGRLRRALEHYYLVAGGSDPVVIRVPRGGYVPVFGRGEAATPAPVASVPAAIPAWLPSATVSVLPLEPIPVEADSSVLAEGLSEELSNDLCRYQDLTVVPWRREMFPAERAIDHAELGRRLGARFLLEGSVRWSPPVVKVSVRLIDTRLGRQVWAQAYRPNPATASSIEIQEEVARMVAGDVGGEHGIIMQGLAAEARETPPARLSPFQAVVAWYDLMIRPTHEASARCLTALRSAVEREPTCGPAWSALAELMARAHTLELPGVEDPLGRMVEYARRGATLTPRRQLSRMAMAHCLFVLGEREAFLREVEATLALNPKSPFYAGAIGYLLVLAGELDRGRSLLERAIATNPCYPRVFNHALCIYHYMKGDHDAAYQETLKASFGIHFWGPLLRAAVLGQLGRTVEAEAATAELLELVPDFESRAHDLTNRPILSEDIVAALLEGLHKAGLRVQES